MRNTANEVGRIARLLQQEINRSVLPEGVSRQQYQILVYISRQDHDVFQRDVEAFFSMPRSTVSGLMKELEQTGLILRCQVESDSRLKRLVLTDKGREVCRSVRQRLLDLNRQLTGGISDEEFSVFWQVADKMRANLAQA
ncbi:MAG: winged helix-turn-helix transcriptional regulator [Firmicutes bacterium]|nr:winged helix-turn-helix transcriptional regulator [Bacillota bacterium]